MSFTPEQTKALAAKLDPANVKPRTQAGRTFHYIEGWHAEAEANRIFGFDGWDAEVLDLRLVQERERSIGSSGKAGWGVSYVARVRVTVRAGDKMVVREGVGAGHGIDADLGNAHESAAKEAETDAEKRALKKFGNPFGLALYDKSQANVGVDEEPEEPFDAAVTALRIEGLLRTATTKAEIAQIWNADSREDRAKLKKADPALYARLSETLVFEQQRVSPKNGADVPAAELTH